MKRKAVLTLALALVLTAVLAAPAFAAELNLGAFTVPADSGHNYWFSDGTDSKETPIKADMLKNATEIRIEFTAEPEGDIQFVFMGDGNGWSWTQFDGIFGPGQGTSLVIKLSDYPDFVKAASGEKGEFKVALGYWNGALSDIIKSATLVYSSGGGGGGASKTGDTTMIALAVVALLMAAGATVLVTRKIKV